MDIPTSSAAQASAMLADAALADHPKRLITMHEVERLVGERKTSIYAKLANPDSAFPRPIKIGRSTRFVLGEVLAFIDQQIAERDAGATANSADSWKSALRRKVAARQAVAS